MKRIIYLLSLLFPACAAAQQLPVHNQFFLNPYVINPASVGAHGQAELSLSQRQQMHGTANAPVTTAINLQVPSRGATAFGINVVDHRYGMLANTSTLATFGYAFKLGQDHFLRLGASGGMGKYSVDRNRLESETDWSRIASFNNKSFVDAQFGVSYQLRGLTLGLSAPTLLNPKMVNTNAADPLDFRKVSYYLANAGYHLQLSKAFAVSPQVQYRYATNFPSQYQAVGTLHLGNVWAGGGYRQDAGPIATAGARIKDAFTLGYVYEPAANGPAGAAQATHEVVLSVRFGPKKSRKEEVAEARETRQQEDHKKATQQAKEKAAKEKAASKKLAARQAADEKAEAKAGREKDRKEKARTAQQEKAAKEKAKHQRAREQKAEAKKAKREKERARKARKADKVPSRKPATSQVARLTAKPVEQPVTESVVAAGKMEERIEEHHRVHPLELKKSNYVVVGSFNVFDNAVRYTRALYERGLRADYRYSSKTNRYYVFVAQSKDVDEARAERDRTRQLVGIADAWVLIVE